MRRAPSGNTSRGRSWEVDSPDAAPALVLSSSLKPEALASTSVAPGQNSKNASSPQALPASPCGHIPQADAVVKAAAGHEVARVMEGDRPDRLRVVAVGRNALLLLKAPQLDRRVARPRRKVRALQEAWKQCCCFSAGWHILRCARKGNQVEKPFVGQQVAQAPAHATASHAPFLSQVAWLGAPWGGS